MGKHIPGYSTQFLEKFSKELGLTVAERTQKEIFLSDPLETDSHRGVLRVRRLLNKDADRELLFYELTWSEITDIDKQILAYDNSGEHSFRRAKINAILKQFSNDTGPDPMIYLGPRRKEILGAVVQSMCWMFQADWDDLPSGTRVACHPSTDKMAQHLLNDDYAFVSHSLGSRIVIDSMQQIAEKFGKRNAQTKVFEGQEAIFLREFQKKKIPMYMLSNQLPLLQLGRELPDVTGQKEAYCLPTGDHYAERVSSGTHIIAFSDPNDILSYAIPEDFADKYLDSRLCINITNININVTDIIDVFGLGSLANPLSAHVNYDSDDRVVEVIAKGIGTSKAASGVKDNCEWMELIN